MLQTYSGHVTRPASVATEIIIEKLPVYQILLDFLGTTRMFKLNLIKESSIV
jgi:hypothetical protein